MDVAGMLATAGAVAAKAATTAATAAAAAVASMPAPAALWSPPKGWQKSTSPTALRPHQSRCNSIPTPAAATPSAAAVCPTPPAPAAPPSPATAPPMAWPRWPLSDLQPHLPPSGPNRRVRHQHQRQLQTCPQPQTPTSSAAAGQGRHLVPAVPNLVPYIAACPMPASAPHPTTSCRVPQALTSARGAPCGDVNLPWHTHVPHLAPELLKAGTQLRHVSKRCGLLLLLLCCGGVAGRGRGGWLPRADGTDPLDPACSWGCVRQGQETGCGIKPSSGAACPVPMGTSQATW